MATPKKAKIGDIVMINENITKGKTPLIDINDDLPKWFGHKNQSLKFD